MNEQSVLNLDYDPRTSMAYGQVEEEEIIKSFAEAEGMSAVFETPVHEIVPAQSMLSANIDMESPANVAVRDAIEITRISTQSGMLSSQSNTLWNAYRALGDEAYRDEVLMLDKQIEKLNTGLPEDMKWGKRPVSKFQQVLLQVSG